MNILANLKPNSKIYWFVRTPDGLVWPNQFKTKNHASVTNKGGEYGIWVIIERQIIKERGT
jgi:hypothetical protein